MEIKFDIDLTTKDMYKFLLNNTYRRLTGIIWVIFSVIVAAVTVITWGKVELANSVLMIIMASLYTVINPVMLYFKAKSQVKKNETLNSTLHYVIDEEQITVSQGELTERTKWKDIYKLVKYGKQVIVYVTSLNAFVWPLSAIGEHYNEIAEIADKAIGKRNKLKRI